jgi:hypothetical protein
VAVHVCYLPAWKLVVAAALTHETPCHLQRCGPDHYEMGICPTLRNIPAFRRDKSLDFGHFLRINYVKENNFASRIFFFSVPLET